MKPRFEIERNPKSKSIRKIRDELNGYNTQQSSISQSVNVAVKMYSEEDEWIGGAFVWQWGGCLEIEYFWIKESVRRKGLGSALLKQLEDLLNGYDQKVMTTYTFSFQAPQFYLKNGFTLSDTISGYPDDVKKFFLKKIIA